jgi:hypothetical protein
MYHGGYSTVATGQPSMTQRPVQGIAKPGQQAAITVKRTAVRSHTLETRDARGQKKRFPRGQVSDMNVSQKEVVCQYQGANDKVFSSFNDMPKSVQWAPAGIALSGHQAGELTASVETSVQVDGSITITNTGDEVIAQGEWVALREPSTSDRSQMPGGQSSRLPPQTVPLRLDFDEFTHPLDAAFQHLTGRFLDTSGGAQPPSDPFTRLVDELSGDVEFGAHAKSLLDWAAPAPGEGKRVVRPSAPARGDGAGNEKDDDIEMAPAAEVKDVVHLKATEGKIKLDEDINRLFAKAERGLLNKSAGSTKTNNPERTLYRIGNNLIAYYTGVLIPFANEVQLGGLLGMQAMAQFTTRVMLFSFNRKRQRVLGQALAMSMPQGELHISLKTF